MSASITSVEIIGLHGYKNISIKINNNRIVLVGANGIGKTTVMNLLYYFLAAQWKRLSEYDFERISVEINNHKHDIRRDEILFAREFRGDVHDIQRRRPIPPSFRNIALRNIELHPDFKRIFKEKKIRLEIIEKISRDINVPIREVMRFIDFQFVSRYPKSAQMEFFDEREKLYERLREVGKNIQELLSGQILYLPTYRRIEQDLKTIFPDLDEELVKSEQSEDSEETQYIELVEFGMEDVEQKIRRVLSELKEKARTELNNLAGGYLRDVIRYEADTYDESIIDKLGDDDMTRILNRVEERTLNAQDKSNIKDAINRIKSGSDLSINQRERYLAHFFSKLVNIYDLLKGRESSIQKFTEVCNKYLESKRIIYDEVNYEINIFGDNDKPLKMKMLSSGEKQIVSLFAHLYLSDVSAYYVIIDEPELSLSVEWQKTFLPDILATERCSFIAAVTHSPFIFDNELENYTVDLKECIR